MIQVPKRILFVLGLLASSFSFAAENDKTTVVSFSRHTFRGTSSTVGPQAVVLPQFGLQASLPILSYAEDATPQGLALTKDRAGGALNQAASQALAALGSSEKFDGRWDEVRAELATQRTFWTALYLRDSMMGQNGVQSPIPVTGCPTTLGKAIDAVSSRHPVLTCIDPKIVQNLQVSSEDAGKFRSSAQEFLTVARSAVGAEAPMATLPPIFSRPDHMHHVYAQVASFASIVEMSAELGAPLPQIFKSSNAEQLNRFGKSAVVKGVNFLGRRFFMNNPGPVADAITIPPLQFIEALPKGSRVAVLTHDDFISSIEHALGLIDTNSDPDELAIYPLETIVFAIGETAASVVRMRIRFDDATGALRPRDKDLFAFKTLWKGTRTEWDAKVQAIHQRVQSWNVGQSGADCLQSLPICKPETLNVLY